MKIVSPHQMSDIESLAYRDGSSESDFMEEAGSGVALVVHDFVENNDLERNIILLCGKGNNGGDAYVAGVHLLHLEYEVMAIQAHPIEECSSLCKINYERFVHEGGRLADDDFSAFQKSCVIIDGLFGTGFRGGVQEPFLSLIRMANASKLPIIAVDIPSGLNGDTGQSETDSESVIIAAETAFLGLPKRGFFLNGGWDHVGKLRYVDFGLPKRYIEESKTDLVMLSDDIVKPLLPVIKRSRHKYQAGYVVGLAGSPGMPGAAILSSTAAYRGGAGIVKLLHREGMQDELASSPPELIKIPFRPNDSERVVGYLNDANACFIGPGIGMTREIRDLLKIVLPKISKPCVIDAEGLSIIAEEAIALPKGAIITPHTGEMARLLKMNSHPIIDEEYLMTCRKFAESNAVTLVLKGGPTYIFHPGCQIFVNPTGDPGMATAGSGDVLTGLIAALLAQGLSPLDAAIVGVYVHGLAGEHAAAELTSYGMMASDIYFHFPEAFKFYHL